MSVVLPEQFIVSDKKSNHLKKDNLMGFHNQVEDIHNGVLTVGMVDNGINTELNVTMENGSVFFVTDVEAKDLVYVTVTLSEQENVFAKTLLHFMEFPNQPKKRTISIVK